MGFGFFLFAYYDIGSLTFSVIREWNRESHLNADVDLVELLSASTVINMQVVSKGRLLYGDINIKDVYETKVYSMYGRLQESRQDIIEQFMADK